MVRGWKSSAVKETGCHSNKAAETKVLLSTDFLEWGAPGTAQETTVELWGLLSDWSRDREVSEIGSPGPNNEAMDADDRFDDADELQETLPCEGLQLSHELMGQMVVSEVAVGGGHCILVSECGRSFGYGCNSRGQLGIGGEELESATLLELPKLKSHQEGSQDLIVLGAACGSEHTVLLARSQMGGSPRQAWLLFLFSVLPFYHSVGSREPGKAAARPEGPPPSPSSLKGRDQVLYSFLRGEKPDDCEGRMLDDILRWDDRTMEAVHDYVQWIFPTDEASMFNSAAPLLSPELQAICRHDEKIQDNFDRILERFLSFLGLQMEGKKITKAKHFDSRRVDCWSSFMGMNHNWLRISRVLHCLGMIGKKEEQQALMKFLESMPREVPEVARSMPHWRQRAAAG
eukprot:symbB.v1.2.021340.t1/scaffold1836.1/size99329/11